MSGPESCRGSFGCTPFIVEVAGPSRAPDAHVGGHRRDDVERACPNGHRGRVQRIVFTGASGPAVQSVVSRVAGSNDVVVVVLDGRGDSIPGAHVHGVDLVGADLAPFVRDADAVVHLGCPVDDRDPDEVEGGRLVAEARAVLDAALGADVPVVAVVSSALVLGALSSNPVPMTEQAVVHPEAGFRPAVELAEIERIVAESSDRVTVLRAAPVVADEAPGWLASELHRSLAYPVEDKDPGLQYLHAADLGDAITTVLASAPGGVVHVAPDGALSGAERRALETRPRLRVSERVAHVASSIRATARGSGTPEGVRPYLSEEWLLANDRLRGLGWEPGHTNEEAYVAAFRAAPWSMIPSGRRQELLLGGVGAIVAGVAVGAAVLLRRRHR